MNNLIKCFAVLLLGVLFFAGCDSSEIKEEDTTEFSKLSWLKGQWEAEQGDAELFESWNGVNYRIMEGSSYTIQNGDRVYAQSMRLEQSNNKIFLILSFRDRTEKYTYDLSEINDSRAVFVNREDLFPKKIIYERLNNRMEVQLIGEEGDVASEYEYKKTG